MRLVIMLLFLLGHQQLMSQELYRWQDANGQWHFGDAASSAGQSSTVVDVSDSTQNIVKIPKVKTIKTKSIKSNVAKSKAKQAAKETLAQKKLRCDKKRDELRFKAFRTEERNQYDHECISEMKW
ncbi:MAG: DUF4124 domain-containing protein [Moraxellaceae bacterium]|nr:DUF4124 domain-containing protein [Moraxellaceae bacterium]HQV22352.1 DUF4124 domain-containing protein [Agitococcus sp.]